MRISQAGIRTGLPTTHFATQSSHGRQVQLGLRHRIAPLMTSHAASQARVPLLDALRSAARGSNGTSGSRPQVGPLHGSDGGGLRRSDSMTWAQPTGSQAHRPRSRSAAPWRG